MSRMRTNALTIAVFGALLLAGAVKTKATPTVIATRSGLGSNDSAIDFESSTSDPNNIPFSLTFLGVTFSGDTRRTNAGVEVLNGFNVGAAGTNVLTTTGNNISDTPANPIFNLVISLPTGTTEVGFDLKNSTGGGALGSNTPGSYEIYVNGALFETVATTFNTFSFVGFSDTSGITSIAIRALAGGDPVLDNFAFGPPAAPAQTPAPAALLLLGTGLAGFAAVARRRRKGLKQMAACESSLA